MRNGRAQAHYPGLGDHAGRRLALAAA